MLSRTQDGRILTQISSQSPELRRAREPPSRAPNGITRVLAMHVPFLTRRDVHGQHNKRICIDQNNKPGVSALWVGSSWSAPWV